MSVVMGSNTLIQGGKENVDQHARMRSMHPFLFQGVYIQKRRLIYVAKGGTNQPTHLYNLLQIFMSLCMEAFHQGDPLIGRRIKCSLNLMQH